MNEDTFAGCYRATYLGADALGNVECIVPAVSGSVPLVALSAGLDLNNLPTPGAAGWVMFEGGEASVPVWLGRTSPVSAKPFYYARVRRTVSQGTTIGTIPLTPITMNQALEDPYDLWDGINKLVVPTSAVGRVWMALARIQFNITTGGLQNPGVFIKLNAGNVVARRLDSTTIGGSQTMECVMEARSLSPGDSLQAAYYYSGVTAGGVVTINASGENTTDPYAPVLAMWTVD